MIGTILSILGYLLLAVVIIIIFMLITFIAEAYSWFYFRQCEHCGHTLKYKGLKKNKDESHYLFHCEHCGAWKQLPKEEFFRYMDKNFIYDGKTGNP